MTTRRRRTAWIDTKLSANQATGGQVVTSLLSTTIPTETRGYTLTRIIGRIHAGTVDSVVVDGIMGWDLGIAVVSQEGFAAGVVPDPATPTEFPVSGWIYKTMMFVDKMSSGNDWRVDTLHFDVRAQRKIEQSELVMIQDAQLIRNNAFPIDLSGLVRCLFLLP